MGREVGQQARTTRRKVLGGSLVGLAGFAGVKAAPGAKATAAPRGERLELEGRRWTLTSRSADGAATARGELYLDGERVGDFSGSSEAGGAETHTLVLRDGTIVGMGATAADPEAENPYAIVGGTGRYAGAGGSYVLRQSPPELGGDGTAALTINLDRTELGDGR